jgi:hypothetical protein
MKKIILALALLTHSLAQANSCPDLKGDYYCLVSPEKLTILTVKQWTEESNSEVMNYTFKYRFIDGEPEVVQASQAGISDSQGWTTYCRPNRLVSIMNNGSFRSDFYLEKNHLLRIENGRTAMDCSLKESP